MKLVLLAFLSGVLTLGQALAGVFFLKFWRRTGDRLFGWFAAAFFLLAVQRLLLGISEQWRENSIWLYGLRLVAFVLLLAAIVDKNRKARA